MYICGLIGFCLKNHYFLLILISLEFIVLSLYIYIIYYLISFDYESFFRIIFLTMRVCEGSLGLSILVIIIRSHGSDFVQSINLL